MRLFIAEKPDVARAIVDALGGGNRKDGFYDCGDDFVTWLYGHACTLFDAKDYSEEWAVWDFNKLPILPEKMKYKLIESSKDQAKKIGDLLKKSSSVVHAGDPDGAGQYLVDLVLRYFDYKKPINRLIMNDNNIEMVKKSLHNLKPNSDFFNLSQEEEIRSIQDWLYGINFTRACTLSAKKLGHDGVYSVGRVQTPILGLVVRRVRENKGHVKQFYYDVNALVRVGDVDFKATYINKDSDSLDDKKRLVDGARAKQVAENNLGSDVEIVSIEVKERKKSPLLPFNLLKLQQEASRKFGYKPDETLEITQELREKFKLITYNRSDSQYLNEVHHEEAGVILNAIKNNFSNFEKAVDRSDLSIKSRAFNDSKVTAHHAIIPTAKTVDVSLLNEKQKNIYLIIARSYISQFWNPFITEHKEIIIKSGNDYFIAKTRKIISLGWYALYRNDKGNSELEEDLLEQEIDLDFLKEGDIGIIESCDFFRKETKPQPLYRMDTLLSDLTRVSKYVKDQNLKEVLLEKDKDKEGEHGGIGTPATRSAILANLFERGYLEESGKNIISTKKGEEFYDALPDFAKYPDMTALWHQELKSVSDGELTVDKLLFDFKVFIKEQIELLRKNGLDIKEAERYSCKACNSYLRKIKGNKGFFWGCSNYSNGCKQTYSDLKGKPDFNPKKSVVNKKFKRSSIK